MFFSEGSTPVIEAPSRDIGSVKSPPPQPMSRKRRPLKGSRSRGSRASLAVTCSLMNCSRTGLNTCSTPNLPLGFHHSAAMAENLATSDGSREGTAAVILKSNLMLWPLLHKDGLSSMSTPRRTRGFKFLQS